MRMSSSTARVLTATTAIAIVTAVILLASNFTITNAQQSLTSQQPSAIENGRITTAATTFQSTNDSFSVQVPQGWVIQDLNNTGSALLNESSQGYGILAQLCPEDGEQQGVPLTNGSGGSTNSRTSSTASCQGSDQVIYIIRYPDLDTRIRAASNVTTPTNNNITTDDVLSYHLQKLREVGYRNPQILSSTEVRLNLTNPQTNETIATVPAKLAEMTYSTNSAPNEIRTGYFISTATTGTPPNLGTTKGYAVFYEGSSTTNNTTATEITTTIASGSLAPPPTPVRQVFDSFELIAAPEVAQTIAQDAQAAETSQSEDDGANDDNGGSNDNNNNDDNNDDNGGSNDNNNNDDNNDDNGGSNDNNNNNNGGEDGGGTSNQGISSRGPEHNSDDYDATADDKQTNGDCDGC